MQTHGPITRDVFDLLVRSHRDLQSLVWDLTWVIDRGDTDTAAGMLAELVTMVAAHGRAEEVVCRRLDGATPELTVMVERARASRAAIDARIRELALAEGGAERDDAVIALRDRIEEHVSSQERSLFHRALTVLDVEEPLLLGAEANAAIGGQPEPADLDEDDGEIELTDAVIEELLVRGSGAVALSAPL